VDQLRHLGLRNRIILKLVLRD